MTVPEYPGRGDPDIDKCKRGGIPSRSDDRWIECQSFSGSAMSRMGKECARGCESPDSSDSPVPEQNIERGRGYDSAGSVNGD